MVGGVAGSYLLGMQDVGGGLLLPLTAIQLLWINVIGNGAPALAMGLDRNENVMHRPPRDPQAPLLDRASLRFIVVTGVAKALTGGTLLVLLPRYGFSLALTRTAVFLYESIAQLAFAYPSRRVNVAPLPNGWLHLAVLFGVGLQVLAIGVPGLRVLLGLETPPLPLLLWMAGGVFISWLVAEIFSRVVWASGHQREASASNIQH